MIMTYDRFAEKLRLKIKSDAAFCYELLVTVIKSPNRYTGIFRLTNTKTKLLQNATQSREIKFGDFMEDIVTEYIDAMGYENLDKNIGFDEEGNALSADQVFIKDNTVYLIEQKIRDDHDSSKKRGQYENFRKKYSLLRRTYPHMQIAAAMWFIDDGFAKNRKFYLAEANSEIDPNIAIHITYGGDLFANLFARADVWDEICAHLTRNKLERSGEQLIIPDFDTSDEMLGALRLLRDNNHKLFSKLMSNSPEYVKLRQELFPTGANFSRM